MLFRGGLPLCVSYHLHEGEQPVDCFPIIFHFLEKADSCSRCGPPSCCPLSPISQLLPAVISLSQHPSVSPDLWPCGPPSLAYCLLYIPSFHALSLSSKPSLLIIPIPASPMLHSHRPSPWFSRVLREALMALFAKCRLPSPAGRCGGHLAEGNGWCHPCQRKRCPSSGGQTS